MDKQLMRILMLSLLLFACANMAEAIDRDFVAPAVVSQSQAPGLTYPSGDAVRKTSIEGPHFMKLITAEEDALVHRGSD
ncbi:MAG: hypothetical protein P8164_14830 [Gammaproteobacteria bacterium]